MSARGGGRQTEMEGKKVGGAHFLCGLGKREQFIISALLECINCLGCRKFTFYTLAVLFLMRVKAVKLMQ